MNYLTNYYKNLSEQLQAKIEYLQKILAEGEIPTQGDKREGQYINGKFYEYEPEQTTQGFIDAQNKRKKQREQEEQQTKTRNQEREKGSAWLRELDAKKPNQPDPFTDSSQMTPEMIQATAERYGNKPSSANR